jgi:hypothetical protein
MPILSFLFRSLSVEARAGSRYGIRLAWVGLALLVIFLTQKAYFRVSAPGLEVFRSLLAFDYICMTIISIPLFGRIIIEEREEQALELLRMTALSPNGLLFGKYGGRLLTLAILLAAQWPFAWLYYTLGGILPKQILAGYLQLSCYLVFLSAVALWAGVAARGMGGVTWRCLLLTLPLFAWEILTLLRESCEVLLGRYIVPRSFRILIRKLEPSCLMERINDILLGKYTMLSVGVPVLCLVAGLVFLVLAARCFRDLPDDLAAPEPARPQVITMTADSANDKLAKAGALRAWCVDRCWRWPLAWGTFHFSTGGLTAALFRVAVFIPVAGHLFMTLIGEGAAHSRQDMGQSFIGIGVVGCVLESIWFVSRIFAQEWRWQT